MIPALLVDAVAAYRLTKLVTDDVLTQPIREAIIEFAFETSDPEVVDEADLVDGKPSDYWQGLVNVLDDPPKLAKLVTCRWCAGVWVAAGVVVARRVAPRAWAPVADALALSAAAALIARLED